MYCVKEGLTSNITKICRKWSQLQNTYFIHFWKEWSASFDCVLILALVYWSNAVNISLHDQNILFSIADHDFFSYFLVNEFDMGLRGLRNYFCLCQRDQISHAVLIIVDVIKNHQIFVEEQSCRYLNQSPTNQPLNKVSGKMELSGVGHQ